MEDICHANMECLMVRKDILFGNLNGRLFFVSQLLESMLFTEIRKDISGKRENIKKNHNFFASYIKKKIAEMSSNPTLLEMFEVKLESTYPTMKKDCLLATENIAFLMVENPSSRKRIQKEINKKHFDMSLLFVAFLEIYHQYADYVAHLVRQDNSRTKQEDVLSLPTRSTGENNYEELQRKLFERLKDVWIHVIYGKALEIVSAVSESHGGLLTEEMLNSRPSFFGRQQKQSSPSISGSTRGGGGSSHYREFVKARKEMGKKTKRKTSEISISDTSESSCSDFSHDNDDIVYPTPQNTPKSETLARKNVDVLEVPL